MAALLESLHNLLQQHPKLNKDGVLIQQQVTQLGLAPDALLLQILLSNKATKAQFFVMVGATPVFDKQAFLQFVNNRAFLPDSYTAFTNKIGLIAGNQFINQTKEVVLAWPYKDGLLVGGQQKETEKTEEVFFNELLSGDTINKLLQPKAFTNITSYKDGEVLSSTNFTSNSNLLMQGNNLLALHSLKPVYAGKVNLIYIDPPFNTGKDSFSYNDKFNHATWLTFMKNRLQIAKELLAKDGSIFVHLDHNEAHYCKVLMDEIFGRENFINEIIWCYTGPGSPGMRQFNRKHDNIFWYGRGKQHTFNADDIRMPSTVHSGGFKGEMDKNSSDQYSSKGKIPEDWWPFAVASRFKIDGIKRVGYNTEKPYKLLERIIKTASNEGDLVLDFFGGSAATAWMAASLNRRFITIEQMDNTIQLAKERLIKTTNFTFMQLAAHPLFNITSMQATENKNELLKILDAFKNSTARQYDVTDAQITSFKAAADNLSFQDCYQFVCRCFDMNNLYVCYADMADESLDIAAADQQATHQFYKQKF